jgi:hypothetical protein
MALEYGDLNSWKIGQKSRRLRLLFVYCLVNNFTTQDPAVKPISDNVTFFSINKTDLVVKQYVWVVSACKSHRWRCGIPGLLCSLHANMIRPAFEILADLALADQWMSMIQWLRWRWTKFVHNFENYFSFWKSSFDCNDGFVGVR